MVRGVRGAITVEVNQEEAILLATRCLLEALLESNSTMRIEELASAWFTTTHDLTAVHPAKAARQLGWKWVPLMCSLEISVPGGLEKCIRVLLHWNTGLPAEEIHHVYLGEAKKLRPDLGTSHFPEAG
jgi:chorismate mutase